LWHESRIFILDFIEYKYYCNNMGNCNTKEEVVSERNMKAGPIKTNGITIATFSGPDAVFIEKNPERNVSFSDPVFFSARKSRLDSQY
jgi:hypothetical protein